jgi:DNA repair protein RadD
LGAEYNMKQLQDHVDKPNITRQAVEEMLWWGDAENRNCWMVFATGVNHCEHVAEVLNEYGVPAIAIHSKSKKPGELIERFKAGEWRAAVSMNKLTTGVDIPQIDLIGVMRHTMSSSLWVQMLGRGTRPVYAGGWSVDNWQARLAAIAASVKPNGCRVLDFARNTENLGPINDPIVPERKKRKGGSSSKAPFKLCPKCAEYNNAAARFCKSCQHEFPINVYMDGVASDLDVMVRRPVVETQPDPVVEDLAVVNITYHLHKKKNKPDSLRVSYFCQGAGNMPRMFTEYVCLEHVGPARDRAVRWWRDRCIDKDPPANVARAIELSNRLRIPKRIRVWINPPSKHPEIQHYEYDREAAAQFA